MLKLRKILLYNWIYYLIFLIVIIYFLIFTFLIKHESIYKGNEKEIIGKIVDYNIDGNYFSFIIKSKEKVKCTYYIKNQKEKYYLIKNIKYGLEINLIGRFLKPINNTIPNTFNYKKYLKHHYIYYIFEVDNYKITTFNENIFYKVKNKLVQKINSYESTKDYLLTFIIGNKNYILSETISNYQRLGVSHLFAISGMHISLFSVILLNILKKLKVFENKRYVITIIFLIIYTFLAGFSASILRATIFFSLLSLNKIFYTHIKIINIFLLTISLLIIINPFILFDLGAQYSLITSFGLILFSKKLIYKNYFKSLFMVSLIAFFFSLPITAINFYEVNIFSIINNLVFVPLITFIIYPLSLLILFVPFLEPILNFLINILEYLANLFSKFSFNFLIPKINFVFWIIYYSLLLIYYKFNKKMTIVVIFILLVLNQYKNKFSNNYYIYYLDVGQGDSSILISPKFKEVIMIDTGGKMNYIQESWQDKRKKTAYSNNTIMFLKSLGINKIDLLIISHGDEDHAGETLNIAKNIKIKNVLLNNYDNNLEKVIRNNLKVISKYNSICFNFQIFNEKNKNDENKDSLIAYFNIKGYKFIFMGDASKEEERILLKKYNFLEVTIIKLGHHGSKTSSDIEFLKAISPKIAIISSGRNNRFNHPHYKTLETLNNLNITYYNTEQNGTILFKINSNIMNKFFYKP